MTFLILFVVILGLITLPRTVPNPGYTTVS